MASLIASTEPLKFVRHYGITRDKRPWKCVRDSTIMYLVLAAIFYCLLVGQLGKGKKYLLGWKRHLIIIMF